MRWRRGRKRTARATSSLMIRTTKRRRLPTPSQHQHQRQQCRSRRRKSSSLLSPNDCFPPSSTSFSFPALPFPTLYAATAQQSTTPSGASLAAPPFHFFAQLTSLPLFPTHREPGIASPPPPSPPPPTPHLLLLNRLAILRLLTLLISLPSLLTPPSLFPVLPNRWRDALVSARSIRGQDRNVVLCLLCSVVNTAFAPSSSSASNPSGGANEGFREKAQRLATEAARKAPAASGFLAEGPVMEDYGTTKERLRTASVQFLAVVLAQHALAEEVVSTSPSSSAAASEMKEKEKGKGEENLFTFYLSRLHRPSDLSFLLSGVLSLLSSALSPPSSSSSLLPFSLPLSLSPSPAAQADSPGLANEALVVLWRLIEVDRKFASWVGRVERAEEGKAERGGRNRLVETVVSVVAAMGRWRGDESAFSLPLVLVVSSSCGSRVDYVHLGWILTLPFLLTSQRCYSPARSPPPLHLPPPIPHGPNRLLLPSPLFSRSRNRRRAPLDPARSGAHRGGVVGGCEGDVRGAGSLGGRRGGTGRTRCE